MGRNASTHILRHPTSYSPFGSLYNAAATKCFFEATKEWNWSLSRAPCPISRELKLLETPLSVKLHHLCALVSCNNFYVAFSLVISLYPSLFSIADWVCSELGRDRATKTSSVALHQSLNCEAYDFKGFLSHVREVKHICSFETISNFSILGWFQTKYSVQLGLSRNLRRIKDKSFSLP